jgi:hypothetical protein
VEAFAPVRVHLDLIADLIGHAGLGRDAAVRLVAREAARGLGRGIEVIEVAADAAEQSQPLGRCV